MRKILTALVALVSLIASVPIVTPAVQNYGVTGTVTVEPWCDISATSPVSFGSMKPGDTSASDATSVVSMPTGNQASTSVNISGSAWIGGTDMAVSQTHWSLTGAVAYGSMNALDTVTASAGTFGPTSPETVYFKLNIPTGQAAASYTQTITFTACS